MYVKYIYTHTNRVKYLIAPCDLKILFFALSVFIFIIEGTYAMEKDGNGTSRGGPTWRLGGGPGPPKPQNFPLKKKIPKKKKKI
jgi:hypothetical protein